MVRKPLRRYRLGDQDPVYWPDDELSAKDDLSLEANALSEAKLKKIGATITKIRKRLRDSAHKAAKEDLEP